MLNTFSITFFNDKNRQIKPIEAIIIEHIKIQILVPENSISALIDFIVSSLSTSWLIEISSFIKTLNEPIYGIWAMTKNKSPDKFIKQFRGIFKKIITINIENESASLSNKFLLNIARQNNYKSEMAHNFSQAIKKISSKEKKVICIFGSLYLCGNVLNKN